MTDPISNPTTAPTTEMQYRYFVSYSHGRGFGSIQIISNRPADNIDTVNTFRETISESTRIPLYEVVVLNYVPLATPDTAAQDRLAAAEQALRDLLSMVDQFDTPRDPGRVQAFVGDVRQVALRGLGHRRG